MDTIYKTSCPQCHATNYVNNGDENDMTAQDINGVRCHSCKHEYLLDSDADEVSTPYYEDGFPHLE